MDDIFKINKIGVLNISKINGYLNNYQMMIIKRYLFQI